MKFEKQNVIKILIIKLRAIGDVAVSTIVIPNLRAEFPDADIDFLVEKPSREIVDGNPWLSNVLVFDIKTMSGIELIRTVRRRKYDLIIDLYCNPRSAFLTFVSGARYRVGYPFRGRGYAYNIRVVSRGSEVHNAQFNLDPLVHLGIPIVSRKLYMPLSSEAKKYADEFYAVNIHHGDYLIGLIPAGGWEAKRWPLERYAELAGRLKEKYNCTFIILWGPGQEADVARLKELIKAPVLIPPMTSLQQLGALMMRCAFVVGNDSGPLHISAALQIPTLGIFGPTRADRQGPYGEKNSSVFKKELACIGCNLLHCPIGLRCMKELTTGEVYSAVEELIEKNKINPPLA